MCSDLAEVFNELASRLSHPEEGGPLVPADLVLGAQVLHARGTLLLIKQVQSTFFFSLSNKMTLLRLLNLHSLSLCKKSLRINDNSK